MNRVRMAVGVTLLGVAISACSPSGSSPGVGDASSTDGGDIVSCQSYPGVEDYAPNITRQGQAKLFTFVLISSSPSPPAADLNTWVVQVLDASGQPLTAANLASVVPFMPTMGHGTTTPQVMVNADGSFTISAIYFFMPGIWQTTVVAEAGQMKDTAAFTFCIPG